MATVPLYPLCFTPFLRPMPWGGQRLRNWLGVPFPNDIKIGEAWLLSDHPLHQSVVSNGPLAGMTLRQLVAERSEELLGFHTDRFPLLIKLLDAAENLSVQVHPDDALARTWAPTEGGKSEAWYVLESSPEAAIYLGLKPGVDRPTLLRELGNGTLPLCLRRYDPQPGECYNVPAGSLHALGGGTVVLEVQQTSDATFRLFDWNRVDATGQPRTLHLEAGLACLKDNPAGIGLQVPHQEAEGCKTLVTTPFLRLSRLVQPTSVEGPCILLSLGERSVLTAADCAWEMTRGEACLVPAMSGRCQLIELSGEVIAINGMVADDAVQ